MARYLYSELSNLVQARYNCMEKVAIAHNENAAQWIDKHTDTIEQLVEDHMPHGSGYDSGTKIDLDASHGEKLVFDIAFHHMDEWGGYNGWTEHRVAVTPSLSNEFRLRIGGRNRNGIKEMMYQDMRHALMTDVEWDIMRTWPRVALLGLEIKFIWIDNCRGEMLVIRNGETLYNGSEESRESLRFSGSPLELCKAFCVKYAQEANENQSKV